MCYRNMYYVISSYAAFCSYLNTTSHVYRQARFLACACVCRGGGVRGCVCVCVCAFACECVLCACNGVCVCVERGREIGRDQHSLT